MADLSSVQLGEPLRCALTAFRVLRGETRLRAAFSPALGAVWNPTRLRPSRLCALGSVFGGALNLITLACLW